MASAAAESPIMAGLNPAQQQAVAAGDGPYLILAGPGSGKTRVLTHRVTYLLQERHVLPYRIMAVTFTNKAAREMRHRVEMLLGSSISGLTVGTFHATCARILRIEHEHIPYTQDYAIYDTADQLEVVKHACADLNIDPKRFKPRGLLSGISTAKNELHTPEDVLKHASSYFGEVAGRVYRRYQELLLQHNAMDFDDLLTQTVALMESNPAVAEKYQQRYEYVLVDEFQDTNLAQYVLVKGFAAPHNNIFAVGDPDQSIYAFRGADYRNVLRFERDYPDHHKILLEQNYRSYQNILDAATAVIDHNPQRTPKRLFTGRGAGDLLTLHEAFSDDDEARYVVDSIERLNSRGEYNPDECAIMYRTNAQSRAFEDALNRAGLPYVLVGATRFYARREVKDLLGYLRVIHNPNDTISLERVINTPPRGIGNKTLEQLREWAAEKGVMMGVALLSLRAGAEGPFSPRVRRSLQDFADLLAGWQAMTAEYGPQDILDRVLEDTAYHSYLDDGTSEGEERWENVMELRSQAGGKESLVEWLADVSLVSDTDTPTDEVQGPTLLTLHSAKGLEFAVVFLVGLGDGTLPHIRSIEDEANGNADALSEERRLLYVGLTRAKDRLYLSYAVQSSRYGGSYDVNMPSRFLYDLPEHLLEGSRLPRAGGGYSGFSSYREATSWGSSFASGGSSASGVRQRERTPVPSRFYPGQRVLHATFGEGMVINVRQFAGDEEIEVTFARSGTKRIDSNYLEPLGG